MSTVGGRRGNYANSAWRRELSPRLVLVALGIVISISACAGGASPTSTPRLVNLEISSGDPNTICAGEASTTPLVIQATGDMVVADTGSGQLAIRWPPGYRAVFDPEFVGVETETGAMFARPGDNLNTADGTFGGDRVCYEGIHGIDILLPFTLS